MEGMPVNLKTYRAYSMAEALAAVKQHLGDDAIILNTRSFKRGGILGLGSRTVIEITATPAEPKPRLVAPSRRAGPTGEVAVRGQNARRAYAGARASGPATNPTDNRRPDIDGV